MSFRDARWPNGPGFGGTVIVEAETPRDRIRTPPVVVLIAFEPPRGEFRLVRLRRMAEPVPAKTLEIRQFCATCRHSLRFHPKATRCRAWSCDCAEFKATTSG